MKAILLLDMPNNCEDCPCFYDWLHCQAKDGLCVIDDGRPEGCPLKPLPLRMKVDYDTISSAEVTDKVVAIGWNACLKEIDE